jgi:transcriptional regulator with XRE-family HTH domain
MTIKKKYNLDNLIEDFGEMTFGRMLTNFREISGESQRDFAKVLDISPQRLNDFEKGRRFPDIKTAILFSKKLKDSEAFFVQILFQDYLRLENLKLKVTVTKKSA